MELKAFLWEKLFLQEKLSNSRQVLKYKMNSQSTLQLVSLWEATETGDQSGTCGWSKAKQAAARQMSVT